MAKKNDDVAIDVIEMSLGVARVRLKGLHPLICNRMSQKVKETLLLPPRRKGAAERASSLKHEPLREFRASPYTNDDPKAPTLIEVPAVAFKRAVMGAAVDVPGAAKAQIGRLLWVSSERVSIYGVPQIFMSVVRSSDIKRTPDVRTRAILREWCAVIELRFSVPILNQKTVMNLLAQGGLSQGIGDWRAEKGSGSYGQFAISNSDDVDFDRIVDAGGRAQQIAAMANPTPYDDETRELMSWFDAEVDRRGLKIVA